VSLSDRDRKIVLVLAPIVVLAAYWFLLLAPKREEAATAGEALAKQEKVRDEMVGRASQLEGAKSSFASDYSMMVRLGKAVPTSVNMPSLIVQLSSAAQGTGIKFQKIAAGEREAAAAAKPAAPSGGSGGSGGNAAAGGAPAQSAPGGATEQANNTKAAGDKQATAKSGVDATTKPPSEGGGSSTPSTPSAPGACAPGLECVPLDFEFQGSFFHLEDFFHRLKRFVKVTNDRVSVGGRLMTVDSLKFLTEDDSFPNIKAEVTATIYLSPQKEGATAGASPQSPSGSPATPAGGNGGGGGGTPASAPTATATR